MDNVSNDIMKMDNVCIMFVINPLKIFTYITLVYMTSKRSKDIFV